ncbi:MAG: type II secretion system F family protein [Actinomycetota bacterium]|nr:type II secretion system F family protein [Actinomycetota bacterium]
MRFAIDDLITAECLRSLAALVRSGLPVRAALLTWPAEVLPAARPAVAQVARRLSLGDNVESAVGVLHPPWDAGAVSALRTVVNVHLHVGGDVARMIDAVADGLARRTDALAASGAAAAGMRLSARMVAVLPIVFMPLTGLSHVPITDLVGMSLFAVGLLLCGLGLWWMGRLAPAPPARDGIAWLADILSGALHGGNGLHRTLEAVADRAPADIGPSLARAGRIVALGATWGDGLRRSGCGGLTSLAVALDRGRSLGVPIADSLATFARRRDEAATTAFEAEIRKAPVRMVLPLTLCVLPAFGLLALAPFLRGLASF